MRTTQAHLNRALDGEAVISIQDPIFKAPERSLLDVTPVNREIGQICKKTGIEKFAMHAFLATFATRLIEAGTNPRTVHELLGHADYGLTMNLYGHVVDETKAKAMESLHIIM